MKHKKNILLFTGILLSVFATGYLSSLVFPLQIPDKTTRVDPDAYSLRRQDGYSFINPLLECELFGEGEFVLYAPLENELYTYIEKVKKEKKVTEVSVYFRDLNNGPWFGIAEKEDFSPASLLKLPILITYYKQSESDPEVLQKKYLYEGKVDLNESEKFRSKEQMDPGKEYSVDDLIARMIIYSDNNALDILSKNIDLDAQKRTYEDFGLDIPGVTTVYDYMSVRGYASFFRVLYNSTYLERDLSEKALEMLSRSEFSQGLRAGAPKEVDVAHKFGERTNAAGANQLHDCGIVYEKSKPYVLCVMTRGSDMNALTTVLQDISKSVYQYVSTHNASE